MVRISIYGNYLTVNHKLIKALDSEDSMCDYYSFDAIGVNFKKTFVKSSDSMQMAIVSLCIILWLKLCECTSAGVHEYLLHNYTGHQIFIFFR